MTIGAGTQVRSVARHLLNFATTTLVLAAIVLILFLWLRIQPPASIARNIPWVLLMTGCISACAILLLLLIAPIVGGRHPAVQWLVYLPTFAAAGGAGTLAAAGALYVLGLVPATRVAPIVSDHLRGAIPGAMAIGTFFMTIEIWKARVQAKELALQTLRLERERAERLASEAQLASLTARVQPHFLFNTLNSIAALVRESPDKAERMVEQLSAVLRGSLESAMTVPLERELKLVTDYLQIQRARFGERLRFTVDSDASALDGTSTPPFAVQTLVENCVKFVAARRPEGVAIAVRAFRADDDVLVDVSDDGPGFDAEAVETGRGLDDLGRRLRTVCGPRATLELRRGRGTMTVRLRLPSPCP